MTTVIGLTGNIGSGKSTVARLLLKLGASVIDTDKLAHEIYRPGTLAWKQVVDAFGRQVLNPDGMVDRRILGRIVFNDAVGLHTLNKITHKAILGKVRKLVNKYRKQHATVVIIEAPLLIEAGWGKMVDAIWVITTPKVKVFERLKKQRRLTENEISSRTNTRLSDDELIKYANAVIYNDGSRGNLKKQVAELWAGLTEDKP